MSSESEQRMCSRANGKQKDNKTILIDTQIILETEVIRKEICFISHLKLERVLQSDPIASIDIWSCCDTANLFNY